jgi:hypothetical protein
VNETASLLAAWAPMLRQAVRDSTKKGHAYSGKHRKHDMNLQVIASPTR